MTLCPAYKKPPSSAGGGLTREGTNPGLLREDKSLPRAGLALFPATPLPLAILVTDAPLEPIAGLFLNQEAVSEGN